MRDPENSGRPDRNVRIGTLSTNRGWQMLWVYADHLYNRNLSLHAPHEVSLRWWLGHQRDTPGRPCVAITEAPIRRDIQRLSMEEAAGKSEQWLVQARLHERNRQQAEHREFNHCLWPDLLYSRMMPNQNVEPTFERYASSLGRRIPDITVSHLVTFFLGRVVWNFVHECLPLDPAKRPTGAELERLANDRMQQTLDWLRVSEVPHLQAAPLQTLREHMSRIGMDMPIPTVDTEPFWKAITLPAEVPEYANQTLSYPLTIIGHEVADVRDTVIANNLFANYALKDINVYLMYGPSHMYPQLKRLMFLLRNHAPRLHELWVPTAGMSPTDWLPNWPLSFDTQMSLDEYRNTAFDQPTGETLQREGAPVMR